MRLAPRPLVSLLVALLVLAGCSSAESDGERAQEQASNQQATATPSPTATPLPSPTPTATPVATWCTDLAPQIQEAAFDALLTLQPDPARFEQAFRLLLIRLQQAEPNAPVEIALTLTSAREGLEDLIRLLEDANWERDRVDSSRLARIDGAFEGALNTLDMFTIQECDQSAGILSPGDDGPADWCEGRIIQVQVALLQALTLSSEGAAERAESSYRSLLSTLLEYFDGVPASLEVITAFTIDSLLNHLDFLEELNADREQRALLGNELTDQQLLAIEQDLRTEAALLTADLLESLDRFDEYSVFSCGFESVLVGVDTGIFDEELAQLDEAFEIDAPEESAQPSALTPTPTPTGQAEQTAEPTPTAVGGQFLSLSGFLGEATALGLTDAEAICLVDALLFDSDTQNLLTIDDDLVAPLLATCGLDDARIEEILELGLVPVSE